MNKFLITMVTAVAGMALPAEAAVFTFSYSGISADVAGTIGTTTYSGTLTTSDIASEVGGRNAFTVLSVDGKRNGVGLSLLAPDSFLQNDNYLFLDGERLTNYGLSFKTAEGLFANLYYEPDVSSYADLAGSSNGATITDGSMGNLVVTAVPRATTSAVPESATWAMMIAGFGMVGATMRRRQVTVSFA